MRLSGKKKKQQPSCLISWLKPCPSSCTQPKFSGVPIWFAPHSKSTTNWQWHRKNKNDTFFRSVVTFEVSSWWMQIKSVPLYQAGRRVNTAAKTPYSLKTTAKYSHYKIKSLKQKPIIKRFMNELLNCTSVSGNPRATPIKAIRHRHVAANSSTDLKMGSRFIACSIL
jgi:hypothetical protein